MKNQLSQLKQIFNYYSPFWTEWTNCEYNGLSEQEIHLINEHVKNNYAVNNESSIEFSPQVADIEKVVSKLQEGFSDYLNFAFVQFRFSLIHSLSKTNVVSQLKLPVPLLPLNAKLIDILLRFDTATLNELFAGRSDKTFEEMKNFREVLEFKAALNYLEPFHITANNQNNNRTINWN